MVNPLKSMYITSKYGMRLHPVFKYYKMHLGIDLRAKTGTKTYSILRGKVKVSKHQVNSKGQSVGLGSYIVIEHELNGEKFCTMVCHLSKRYVKAGDTVTEGQVIGLTGNSGSSSAPHLHFAIHYCPYSQFFTYQYKKTGNQTYREFKHTIDPDKFLEDNIGIKQDNREEEVMQQLYTYCGRTLYKGKTGEDVKVWQIAMKKAGYYTMAIDGSIGNGGHNAIIKFQTERNLVVDGFFGRGSASELNVVLNEIENNQNTQEPVINDLPSGVYSKYSKGEHIKQIQSWLKSLGYEIDEDGSFGNGTEAVLKFFQEDNKLQVTGKYDVQTRDKMLEKPRCKYQEFKYDKQTTVIKMRIEDFHTVLIDVPKRKSLYNIMKSLSWKPKLLINGGLFNMTSEGEDLNIMIDTYKQAGSVYFSKKGMKMNHYDKLSFGKPDATTKSFLGGSPYILENGEFTTQYYETLGKSYTDSKHPRNGVGIDDEFIYVVLVKGRASWLGYYGVTLQQLATIFKNLGCKYAQNNDGGGSVGAIDNLFRWIFKSWRTIGNAIAFYRRG